MNKFIELALLRLQRLRLGLSSCVPVSLHAQASQKLSILAVCVSVYEAGEDVAANKTSKQNNTDTSKVEKIRYSLK